MLGGDNPDSVSSSTISGFGTGGGAPAQVIVSASNPTIASGGSTTIEVFVTDAAGRRTEASIILTSSRGGSFNGDHATITAGTVNGYYLATYTYSGTVTEAIETEITATVAGTTLRGSCVISIVP